MKRNIAPGLGAALTAIPWLVGLLALGALVYWGGLPTTRLPAFLAGVLALVATLTGSLTLARWLLTAPVESRLKVSADMLGWLGFVVVMGGSAIVVGAFWDEIWHRRFGLPFGEDFFWRPHLLMYAGLLTVVISSVAATSLVWRRTTGAFRSRFARAPRLSLLAILGAFLAYVLPADPAWHALYGADLTAWSLPHLVLGGSFVAIALVGASLQLASFPRKSEGDHWRRAYAVRTNDAIPLVAFAFALLQLLQLLTTEYDGLLAEPIAQLAAVYARPEWLYPATIAGVAGFVGVLAVRTLRLPGAAILVGLLALGIRVGLLTALAPNELSADAYLLALPPLIAIDILAAAGRRRWWQLGLAAGTGVALATVPLMTQLVAYPVVTWAVLPAMVVGAALTACGAAWAGEALGDALRKGPAERVEPTEHTAGLWRWALAGGAYLAAVAWFIATATPPV